MTKLLVTDMHILLTQQITFFFCDGWSTIHITNNLIFHEN